MKEWKKKRNEEGVKKEEIEEEEMEEEEMEERERKRWEIEKDGWRNLGGENG